MGSYGSEFLVRSLRRGLSLKLYPRGKNGHRPTCHFCESSADNLVTVKGIPGETAEICAKDGPGGNKGVPNEGVQGYLNWSTFEARKARFKASYESRL